MSIGARRFSRSLKGTYVSPPPSVFPHGVVPWGNPYVGGNMINRGASVLSQSWVGGISAFAKWRNISNNGSTWNFTPFDKISEMAANAGKPWMLMVILGSNGNGLPDYVINQVPSGHWINTDGATFPVFWSPKANELSENLFERIAERYNNDPWLCSVRMTTYWSTHGEPWFAGGESGKAKWVNLWNSTGNTGNLSAVQAAYQQHEKDKWTHMINTFDPSITISAAGGDGLYDRNGSVGVGAPERHPARLTTWTWVRQQYGDRTSFQFNGVNAGHGAEGYGEWLRNFSPDTSSTPLSRRGRIGAQPVAAIGSERLSYSGAATMLYNLIDWKYSYFELYFGDAVKVIDNVGSSDWTNVRNALNAVKNSWTSP